jgi:hypothetical protein
MRLSLTALCSLLAVAAFAQSDHGVITGVVRDPAGAVLGSAPVQAKNAQTGASFRTVSSEAGLYKLPDLPPGEYTISVAVGGLKPFEKKNVTVAGAKITQLDIHVEESTQLSTLGEDPAHITADLKRHTPPTGPAPRTVDGKPDFSGVWWSPRTVDPGKPELLPWAEKVAKERGENNRKDSPQARCLPSAVLRLGPLYEIVQSRQFAIVISDDDSPGFHQIYLDGRSHPADPNPAWYGHSVGRWEGDTLVVDRVGFDERVWLDQESHPHTDKLHVIERYSRPDLGHLETEITVEDPGILARPWTIKRISELAPNEVIYEFICPENNRDVAHIVGQ